MKAPALAAFSLCLALVAAGFSSAAPSKPDLRITDMSPLTVKGTSFKARERVTVIAVSEGTHTRRVRVSQAGAFTATFPDLSPDRCSGASVRAVGSLGSRAASKIPRRACMPASAP